jgi:membrane-associated phospholipid phosphatase
MKRIANCPLWLWSTPFLLLVLSAPLWLHWWEPAMFLAINTGCAHIAMPVWTALSLLGNGWVVLAVTAPLLSLAPRLMWAWMCAVPFATVFTRLGKELIVSARPAAEIDNTLMRIAGETLHTVSMPSGHTTTACAVACAIFLALSPIQQRRHAWLLVLAAGVGLSRIAVGAHWPGDVAVGASLGLLSGLLAQCLLARIPARYLQLHSWPTRALALLVAMAAWVLATDPQDFAETAGLQLGLAVFAAVWLIWFAMRSAKVLRAA